jgi:hypothetical protein
MITKVSALRQWKEQQKGLLYTVPTLFEVLISDTPNRYIQRKMKELADHILASQTQQQEPGKKIRVTQWTMKS